MCAYVCMKCVMKVIIIHVCLCVYAHTCVKCAMKVTNTYIHYMCDDSDTHTYVWHDLFICVTVEMPAFMPDRHVIGAQADDWPIEYFGGKCAHDRCR